MTDRKTLVKALSCQLEDTPGCPNRHCAYMGTMAVCNCQQIIQDARDMLKQPLPVVYCTACKHWDQNSGLTARKCCKHGIITKQFDYCSYGEAK